MCTKPNQLTYFLDTVDNKKRFISIKQADDNSFDGEILSGDEYNKAYAKAVNDGNFTSGMPIRKIIVPCGQCLECRLNYSKMWAFRMMLEAKQWKNNYFITLTYNENSLEKFCYTEVPFLSDDGNVICDPDTGEVVDAFIQYSLVPNDVTVFMKNLRKIMQREYGHDNIRFFACGEYGPKHLRPHYHIILFNCPLPDLSISGKSPAGFPMYSSKIIERAWSYRDDETHNVVSKGFCPIQDVSYQSCSYVARYILKNSKCGKTKVPGLKPEFVRMSRNPGIGRDYFEKNFEKLYAHDSMYMSTGDKAVLFRMPKYFDKLYEQIDPDNYSKIKDNRLYQGKLTQKSIDSQVHSYVDYLADKERKLKKKVVQLTSRQEL